MLEVFIMEDIMKEMVVMKVSTNNSKQEVPARKIGSSRVPNWAIRFPRREQKLMVSSASTGYGS
jgi:hypothetical protein